MNYAFPNQLINTNYLIQEILKMKEKIILLEKRINQLENNKISNYLEKDDNYYMI